jgi:hypothetical protein
MRFHCLGLALACLVSGPALAQAPAPVAPVASKVEHVPPEQAVAILGRPVAEPDGKTIGRLIDVLVDAAGVPEAGVIDFGGFLGVGSRTIAVHWSALQFVPTDPKRPIVLSLTTDQIKAAPEYVPADKPAPVVVPAPAPHSDGP